MRVTMTLRSWIFMTALFDFGISYTLIYQRIPIDQICGNLARFYDIIYPLTDIKINLVFDKNSKYQYHTGTGTVVFSPNIYINGCWSHRKGDITSVTAMFTATLTIRFPKRSWVVIEECEIEARFNTRPTLKESGERSVEIVQILVNRFLRASANCGYGLISQSELQPILNAALMKYTSPPPIFYIERDNNVFADRLTSLMEGAFNYYMNRLAV